MKSTKTSLNSELKKSEKLKTRIDNLNDKFKTKEEEQKEKLKMMQKEMSELKTKLKAKEESETSLKVYIRLKILTFLTEPTIQKQLEESQSSFDRSKLESETKIQVRFSFYSCTFYLNVLF